MITSKPANEAVSQDMKLFYRAGGSLSKLLLILLLYAPCSVPTNGRAQSAFVFSFIERFCVGFGRVAGRSPGRQNPVVGITVRLPQWVSRLWCASCAGRT